MSISSYNSATGQLTPVAGVPNVDQILSDTSRNPVANRAVSAALDTKIEKTVDDLVNYYTITQIDDIVDQIENDVDDTISATSENPVQNKVIKAALDNKVDTVTGKGLSTNDYTTTEKNKLAGIAPGAEVNVQSDWNQSTTTADDFIKNKPNIPSGIYYGTSTGQAALQNKAVVISADQNFKLKVGCVVVVKFDANNTYTATADAPVTINVNNTGAKQLYFNNTATPTGTAGTVFGVANHVITYMYDGTYWVWIGHGSDSNTTYSAMSSSELTTGTATASRVVRADYLKTGINSLIDTKIPNTNGVVTNATNAGTAMQAIQANSANSADYANNSNYANTAGTASITNTIAVNPTDTTNLNIWITT